MSETHDGTRQELAVPRTMARAASGLLVARVRASTMGFVNLYLFPVRLSPVFNAHVLRCANGLVRMLCVVKYHDGEDSNRTKTVERATRSGAR
jgi:hypothetical protein